MTTQTQAQVAATLGINVLALWSLSSNPQFPTPASGSNQSVVWNASDITAFAALQSSALARGWKISTAALPTFDCGHASSNNPGGSHSPPSPIRFGISAILAKEKARPRPRLHSPTSPTTPGFAR